MRSRLLLMLAAASIGIAWQLPYGQQVLYPISLLATFAHELGHGLTALLLGAEFRQLVLNSDGSGVAVWQGNSGRVASGLIAAGGLLAPSFAGATVLLLSRSVRYGRLVLMVLAMFLVISVILWTRNLFGVAFLLTLAALFLLSARALANAGATFMLQIIALTLCLSWLKDLDYMFSAVAVVDGAGHPSDTAAIADALWLPYWFWGSVIATVSMGVTLAGIWLTTRPTDET